MSGSKKAFTLVELLVVISIILIASSIIFIGGGGGDGASLSSAQRIVSGIAQGARGQAILKNGETRLIIYNEENDPEKYLRYFGVVYWGDDVDDEGNVIATGWKAATQGTFLPEGIYFDPDLSTDFGKNRGGIAEEISLNYPRIRVGDNTNKVSGGGSVSYYMYGFSSNGTSLNPNEWLTIRAGVLRPEGGGYEINFDDPDKKSLKSALIFRRSGSVTRVDDPGVIK
jgi:prepilin-type N-terminal cleavage/methylation domain-containing protein